MCTGEERMEMLRKAYRLGFDSGLAEGLATREETRAELPENVISFEAFRAGKFGPEGIAR